MMDVPYPMLGKFEHYLKSAPIRVEDKQFSDVITFSFLVKEQDESAVLNDLTALSEGRLEPIKFEELYDAWPEDEE